MLSQPVLSTNHPKESAENWLSLRSSSSFFFFYFASAQLAWTLKRHQPAASTQHSVTSAKAKSCAPVRKQEGNHNRGSRSGKQWEHEKGGGLHILFLTGLLVLALLDLSTVIRRRRRRYWGAYGDERWWNSSSWICLPVQCTATSSLYFQLLLVIVLSIK